MLAGKIRFEGDGHGLFLIYGKIIGMRDGADAVYLMGYWKESADRRLIYNVGCDAQCMHQAEVGDALWWSNGGGHFEVQFQFSAVARGRGY